MSIVRLLAPLLAPLLAMTCACRSSAPRFSDERIDAIGDVTYRATPVGDTIVILAIRALGQASAAGDVVLPRTSLAVAEASPYRLLAGARAWLALSLVVHDADAYEASRRGIAELGPDYSDRRGFDDTTTLVDLATASADHNPQGAALEMQKALRARIAMYVRRARGAAE